MASRWPLRLPSVRRGGVQRLVSPHESVGGAAREQSTKHLRPHHLLASRCRPPMPCWSPRPGVVGRAGRTTTPPPMAATNKCLARSNKSPNGVRATKGYQRRELSVRRLVFGAPTASPAVRPETAPWVTIVMRHMKTLLVALMLIIAPAQAAVSATITIHEPDGDGRVFVDVVGKIIRRSGKRGGTERQDRCCAEQ